MRGALLVVSVLAAFSVFGMPACNEKECEGEACTSSENWCCGDKIMRCEGGRTVVSQVCSGNEICQTSVGPGGVSAYCTHVREPE